MTPECESITEDFKRERIERASDVWSLGCVFAELLVYLSVEAVKAPAAVKDFRNDRKFKISSYIAYMLYGENDVNSCVLRVLEHLKADETLSDGLRLLARIVDKILQYDQAQRPLAADVTRLIFHLTQQTRIAAITATFGFGFEPLDLDLEIEVKRLRIWSETVGLNANLMDVPESTWFAANHSIEEYVTLQLLLNKVETEMTMIATELQKMSPNRLSFSSYENAIHRSLSFNP